MSIDANDDDDVLIGAELLHATVIALTGGVLLCYIPI